MPNLKIVHILHEISDQAISLICNANWGKLEEVHLKVKKNFSSALRRIGKAEWKNLIRLNVCGNELSDQMKNIGRFFDFPNLKQICLNDFITEEVITKIDKAKQPLLEVLDIRNCPVSGIYVFNSENNVGWQELKELYIGSERIKKEEICSGLLNICIYSFPKLTKFSINCSELTKQAMNHLKKAQWKELKQIEISDCEVNGENLQVFNKCDWKKLKQIKLSKLTTDSSIESLPCANWPELTIINLYETDITTLGTMVFGKLREQEMKTICLDFDQREKLPNSMKELFNMLF